MQSARDSLRVAAVEEHLRHENAHDLDGLLSTFGGNAVYEDAPWSERHEGLGAVREYYERLFRAAPDLHVEVK
ncbi:MAG TPA: nuclear transport factor 2 family protein, partial [Myxococcales bacterium]|nr:nuclear transport factor 2 family protein [Myxococcales bacterium]